MVELLGADFPEITARQMDAGRLDFADGSFDLVTAGFVMQVLDDPAAAIAEIRRMLAPAGVFALSVERQSVGRLGWLHALNAEFFAGAPADTAPPDTAPPDSVSTDTALSDTAPPDTALSDTPASAAGSGGPLPTRDELTLAWGDVVLAALPQRAKVRFGAGHFVGVDDAWATFALPNTVHRDRCEECRHEVEQTLASHFGRPVPLRLVVAQPGTPPTDKPSPEPDDEIDLTELRDAPAAEVASPVDHVMQVFEGAEVVED
jgi:SAM-dependent methyltransferase